VIATATHVLHTRLTSVQISPLRKGLLIIVNNYFYPMFHNREQFLVDFEVEVKSPNTDYALKSSRISTSIHAAKCEACR